MKRIRTVLVCPWCDEEIIILDVENAVGMTRECPKCGAVLLVVEALTNGIYYFRDLLPEIEGQP